MKRAKWMGIGLLGLGLVSQAQADDQDAITLGPQPWHSVAVYGDYRRWHGDEADSRTSQAAGNNSGSSSTLFVTGTYAVNPDVNLLAGLSDQMQNHAQSNFMGIPYRSDAHGRVGNYVGISARPVGHATDVGLGVFGVVQTGNDGLGGGQWISGSIRPQYRFMSDWLLTGAMGREHVSNAPDLSQLGLNLLWRPAQRYSMQLSVNRYSYSAYNSYSSVRQTEFGLTGNYYLSYSTSIWASLSQSSYTDQTTSYYPNNFVNQHASELRIGVRYRFHQFE